jgi:hypothetical protein
MTCSDEDCVRSRRSGADDQRWSHRLATRWRAIERSGGAVCGLHRARGVNERGFLG